jgi:hypothetical protein
LDSMWVKALKTSSGAWLVLEFFITALIFLLCIAGDWPSLSSLL